MAPFFDSSVATRAAREAAVLLAVSAVAAVAAAALSPVRIPWVAEWGPKAATPADGGPSVADCESVQRAYYAFCGGNDCPKPICSDEAARAAQTAGVVFLDGRTAQAYAEGHIPGALHIDGHGDDFAAALVPLLGALGAAERIVVYCNGVTCDESIHLARRLTADAGIAENKVRVFFEGWPEWSRRSLPVTKGASP